MLPELHQHPNRAPQPRRQLVDELAGELRRERPVTAGVHHGGDVGGGEAVGDVAEVVVVPLRRRVGELHQRRDRRGVVDGAVPHLLGLGVLQPAHVVVPLSALPVPAPQRARLRRRRLVALRPLPAEHRVEGVHAALHALAPAAVVPVAELVVDEVLQRGQQPAEEDGEQHHAAVRAPIPRLVRQVLLQQRPHLCPESGLRAPPRGRVSSFRSGHNGRRPQRGGEGGRGAGGGRRRERPPRSRAGGAAAAAAGAGRGPPLRLSGGRDCELGGRLLHPLARWGPRTWICPPRSAPPPGAPAMSPARPPGPPWPLAKSDDLFRKNSDKILLNRRPGGGGPAGQGGRGKARALPAVPREPEKPLTRPPIPTRPPARCKKWPPLPWRGHFLQALRASRSERRRASLVPAPAPGPAWRWPAAGGGSAAPPGRSGP